MNLDVLKGKTIDIIKQGKYGGFEITFTDGTHLSVDSSYSVETDTKVDLVFQSTLLEAGVDNG